MSAEHLLDDRLGLADCDVVVDEPLLDRVDDIVLVCIKPLPHYAVERLRDLSSVGGVDELGEVWVIGNVHER